ncbi:MAG TPA: alkaline phosphatase family protein, partial [Acidimicrobiales bacterium]
TPNLCSDMHDCSISTGDNWLKKWLPLLTGTAVYKHHNTVVFVVWDEGEPSSAGENCASHLSDQSCHVVAIVVAPSVKPGTSVGTSFSHYSLLKTSEDLLGVAELGGATSATSMASAFNL